MARIFGYEIVEELSLTPVTRVVRAVPARDVATSGDDARSVILKLPADPFPKQTQVARFEHEASILGMLESERSPHLVRMVQEGAGVALALEDIGGISLDRYLTGVTGAKSLSVTEFLPVAIAIAKAVESVHELGIVHKDVNPSNIILNAATGQVQLIDFGIATQLGRERAGYSSIDALEGSLKYISPEQTGRTNRLIDQRTDFYSLGATFFEMLAGKPPFDASDPLTLVHQHIARAVPSLASIHSAIPEVLSNIITKLLSKSPDERYRSARGIVADLEECLDQLKSTGEIQSFELGANDQSDQLLIPQKLYGRERELAMLSEFFENARTGDVRRGTTILVTGEPGIGKSSLIDEFCPTAALHGASFVSGKFDQYGNNAYSAIIAAMRELVRSVLGEGSADISALTDRMTNALGVNGAIITELVPELELLIGKQRVAEEVSPTEVQKRFQTVFSSFLQTLATADRPVVLFLDDVQWIDSASARLIEDMIEAKPLEHVLLIGSYRPLELSPSTSFGPFLEAIRTVQSKGEVRIAELRVGPISPSDIAQLIAESLATSLERSAPLAEIVAEKTGGNPYFVAELLRYLYREEILHYESDKRRWAWDITLVRQLSVTDNVASLMRETLRRIPEETRAALQAGAAIGSLFSLPVLAELQHLDERSIAHALKPAADLGLIFPFSERSAQTSGEHLFKFAHDRVQEAAYHSIESEEARAALHLTIGRAMERSYERTTTQSENASRLFEVLRHLNTATSLIRDAHARQKLSQMNIEAAERAKATAAFDVAATHYVIARKFFPGDPWQTNADLAMRATLGYAECLYPNGHWEECERLFDELLAHARTPIETGRVRARQVEFLVYASRIDKALDAALAGLRTLGVTLPRKPSKLYVGRALLESKIRLRKALGGKPISELLTYRRATEEQHELVLKLCVVLTAAAYMESQDFFGAVILKMVNHSLEHGFTAETSYGFALYGSVLSAGLGDFAGGLSAGEMAVELAASFQNTFLQGRCEFLVVTLLGYWRMPMPWNLDLLSVARRHTIETGDTQYEANCETQFVMAPVYAGPHLETIAASTVRGMELCQSIRLADTAVYFKTVRFFTNALQTPLREFTPANGLTATAFNDSAFLDYIRTSVYHAARMYYFYVRLLLSMLLNETAEGLKVLEECSGIRYGLTAQIGFADCLAAEVMTRVDAALSPTGNAALRSAAKKTAHSAAKKFKKWTLNAPDNFSMRNVVVLAELSRIQGNSEEAIKQYRTAVQLAIAERNLMWSGMLQERLARMLGAGQTSLIANPEAALFLQEAIRAYKAWGATLKVDLLAKEFGGDPGILLPKTDATITNTSLKSTVTTEGSQLDFESILKSSQALASEIQLTPLIERMMSIIVESAGAERGVLLLNPNSDSWSVQAEYSIQTGQCLRNEHALENSSILPVRLVEFVLRTRQELLLHDASSDARYGSDPWIQHQKAKSVLCVPILYQGTLVAAVYLENNLATSVFTERRVELLRLLAGQIATSLNNALLYENLEERVRERTVEIDRQKREIERQKAAVEVAMEKSETLLLNILPAETAQELKDTGKAQARSFEEATVLFADVKSFTTIARPLRPEELVAELDACFGAFDRIITKHSVEKIKTVGDAYLAVGGVPVTHGDDALHTVEAALEMQRFAEHRRAERERAGLFSFAFRIGIHTGPVTAGIVGSKKFAYDIWGDTVNIASRMESACEPGKVNLSRTTYERVKNKIQCEPRGRFAVKNAGELEMYFAIGE